MQYVNLWMTLTNLAVVPTLLYGTNPTLVALAGLAALASTLMHISERKHGLPGFALANWATTMLNFDRVCAVLIGTYMFINFYHRHDLLAIGVIGLVCMTISEYPRVPLQIYIVYHTLWHCIVYYTFYRVATLPS